jgi:hypothetical protein
MACPFFVPHSRPTAFSDFYQGECAAGEGSQIADELLERCCNNGYAREVCNRAAQSDADAFRFMVKSHANGVVHIAWSSERNHHPVAVGNLAIEPGSAPETPLERQASAYAAEFLSWYTRL